MNNRSKVVVRMGDVRLAIREALSSIDAHAHRRMSFEDLLRIQQELDERLTQGQLGDGQYDREWGEVLRASGWTQRQYEHELDRRWDYMDALRTTPEPDLRYHAN